MTLQELGWNSFFKNNFQNYGDNGLIPARVLLEQKSELIVFSEKGESTAKLAGKIRFNAQTKSDLPVIGDWVALRQLNDGTAIIEAILPRQSQIVRISPGMRKKRIGRISEEQVIGANIDIIFIVTGLDRDYNIRRIERYLTLVYNSGAIPVIVLNKSDLCSDVDEKLSEIESIAIGVPVHVLSAASDDNLQILHQYFSPGKTIALLGSSGVGKSTIINKLLGYERQKVREISSSVGKGQHTTSSRELIFMPGGGIIVDNPGMREITLSAEDEDIGDTFQDIELLARNCRFSDCRHLSEPGCAVKKAIEDEELDNERFMNYQKMKNEMKFIDDKKEFGSRKAVKEKWKRIMKDNNMGGE
ncbi:ribosome small subunit-dependent GTPase A [candidate division KSB1 bacterium]|nr:ribosome small subunit-dependent GTPase A [candidate division KSB1 bacterium]